MWKTEKKTTLKTCQKWNFRFDRKWNQLICMNVELTGNIKESLPAIDKNQYSNQKTYLHKR